jgi:uncharacterized repeat protein (TIGR01451 family)
MKQNRIAQIGRFSRKEGIPAWFVLGVLLLSGLVLDVTHAGNPPPSVASFTPAQGGIGTEVSINGDHLDGATAVQFNGASASFREGFSGTNLVTTVPSGATTGPITVVTPAGTFVTTSNFTVLSAPPPQITDFSPVSGPAGSSVTIQGANLNEATQVTFNGVSAAFTPFGNTLSVTVPNAATSGPIAVTTPSGTAVSAIDFVVTAPGVPTISSFSPNQGRPGDKVTITGANLTTVTGVQFNGVAAPQFQTFGPSLVATVPDAATSGPITVINPNGSAVTSTDFTLINAAAPVITGFNPTSGAEGATISLTGTNFLSATQVAFGGTSANFVAISDSQLSALVPSGALSGPISITGPAGTGISSNIFFITPKVSSFEPAQGMAGTQVVIHGSNFTNIAAVLFGTVSASFTSVSVTEVQAVVPNGAVSGLISVVTPGGFGVSQTSFLLPPQLIGFDPPSGIAGMDLTISGTNLLETSSVLIGGVEATFTALSPNTINVTIPDGVKTGPITVTTPAGSATSTSFFQVGILSDLTVAVSAFPGSVSVGDFLRYTVTVTNLGPFEATNVVVTEQLPPGVQSVFSPTGADCVQSNNVITCNLGNLVRGMDVAIRITTTVNSGPYLTNQVGVTSLSADPDLSNNNASLLTVLAGAPPPPTNNVSLSVSGVATGFELSWPASASGFLLESAPSLVSPIVWTQVSNTPVVVDGRYTVTQDTSQPARFYRLRSP